MNLIDRIVKAIAENPFPRPWWGGDDFRGYAKTIAEVVHPGITNLAELDALPAGSVIRDATPMIYEKSDDPLTDLYGPWYPVGFEVPTADVLLPAILLWAPGDTE